MWGDPNVAVLSLQEKIRFRETYSKKYSYMKFPNPPLKVNSEETDNDFKAKYNTLFVLYTHFSSPQTQKTKRKQKGKMDMEIGSFLGPYP